MHLGGIFLASSFSYTTFLIQVLPSIFFDEGLAFVLPEAYQARIKSLSLSA